MLVIIVGDDQSLRLQLTRALGAGRFELLCSVPSVDVVPQVSDDGLFAALLAHKSLATMRTDIEKLRARFGDRVAPIAIASDDGRELLGIVGEVDDFVAWTLGSNFLLARLHVVQKRLNAVRTAKSARPMRSHVEELFRTLLSSGRDQLFVWDLASGRVDWPLADPEAAGLPKTRAEWLEGVEPDELGSVEIALERHLSGQLPYAVAMRRSEVEPMGTSDAVPAAKKEGERPYRLHLERGALLGSRREGRIVGLVTDIEVEAHAESIRRLESRRSGMAEISGLLAEELSASLLVAFTNLDAAVASLTPASLTPQSGPTTAKPAAEIDSRGLRLALEDARGGLQTAFDWTRRLMALGRRQPPQPEYLALQDVVQDLADSLARRLGSAIQLEVVSRDAPGVVLADPLHLESVLSILTDRAVRVMPTGGRVRLLLSTVLLRDELGPLPAKPADGRWAKLRLEDEGPRMPPSMVEGLFDPMAHGLREELHWTIALATVRSIVLQHEGFIRVVNRGPGEDARGAAFEIFLPIVVRPPARLRRPETGSHVAMGHGELVLVAEDDELVQRMTERILKGAGYRVLVASDGLQAVRLFELHQDEIRLVILDIVMPQMGGRVASERISALGHKVPLLFVSGYTMSIQDTEFIQDSARRFLPKPFNAGQLLREVHVALERRAPG